jgi:hypothetical protein
MRAKKNDQHIRLFTIFTVSVPQVFSMQGNLSFEANIQ